MKIEMVDERISFYEKLENVVRVTDTISAIMVEYITGDGCLKVKAVPRNDHCYILITSDCAPDRKDQIDLFNQKPDSY